MQRDPPIENLLGGGKYARRKPNTARDSKKGGILAIRLLSTPLGSPSKGILTSVLGPFAWRKCSILTASWRLMPLRSLKRQNLSLASENPGKVRREYGVQWSLTGGCCAYLMEKV